LAIAPKKIRRRTMKTTVVYTVDVSELALAAALLVHAIVR
jgi:hypothetical protein